MKSIIKRLRSILEKGDKLDVEEAVVPPSMIVRVKEKSVFFNESGMGASENLTYTADDFTLAYKLLAESILDGNVVFQRNVVEPDYGYLKIACEDLLKRIANG